MKNGKNAYYKEESRPGRGKSGGRGNGYASRERSEGRESGYASRERSGRQENGYASRGKSGGRESGYASRERTESRGNSYASRGKSEGRESGYASRERTEGRGNSYASRGKSEGRENGYASRERSERRENGYASRERFGRQENGYASRGNSEGRESGYASRERTEGRGNSYASREMSGRQENGYASRERSERRENGYASRGRRAASADDKRGFSRREFSGVQAEPQGYGDAAAEAYLDDGELRRQSEEQEARFIEGRNAVLEAFRSGRTIDRILILDGCQDGPMQAIRREAAKQETVIDYVSRERLDQISFSGKHQGVIAYAAAYGYASVEDILQRARDKGEQPFLILLDGIEDPHNLGAILRTANQVGAHGVIIPKRRAVGLTATVARTSAGALNYTPVARVTNLGNTIDELKKEGIWFVCADMQAEPMYRQSLTGPIGLVVGSEGGGVSRLVKEKCDLSAAIPMKGDIDSLNASVAAGVLAYEILRQREYTV